MDSFIQYLLIINIVTFFIFAIDFFFCMRFPHLDDTKANSIIPCVFPIAGGSIGMMLALFVFTTLLRRHRINKDNIAWWFVAITCLIIWILIAAVKFGFVSMNLSVRDIFFGWDSFRLVVLGIYLLIINFITFVAFSRDKQAAISSNNYGDRTPEAFLLGLCLIGGSIGGIIAMNVVHHKTKKWYFVWGLSFFIILDMALIVFAHICGLI